MKKRKFDERADQAARKMGRRITPATNYIHSRIIFTLSGIVVYICSYHYFYGTSSSA